MRDLETIRLAMTAAETGHLVFGTLHTSSAAKTIDRIIDVFPAEEKEMVRAMLSESLQAVISQTLCKTKDGQGRVAAHEIMIGTSAIRNLIREPRWRRCTRPSRPATAWHADPGPVPDRPGAPQHDQPAEARRPRSPRTSPAEAPQPPRAPNRTTAQGSPMKGIPACCDPRRAPTTQDSVLFSTACRPGGGPAMLVPWEARAVEVGARRLSASQGAGCCRRCGPRDKYMAQLQPRTRRAHGGLFEFASVPANRDVIRQDEYGNFMVVLLTGTIAVDRVQPWGEQLRLAETRPATSWARCRCSTAASARPAPR
jgi:hypothetical protein